MGKINEIVIKNIFNILELNLFKHKKVKMIKPKNLTKSKTLTKLSTSFNISINIKAIKLLAFKAKITFI